MHITYVLYWYEKQLKPRLKQILRVLNNKPVVLIIMNYVSVVDTYCCVKVPGAIITNVRSQINYTDSFSKNYYLRIRCITATKTREIR